MPVVQDLGSSEIFPGTIKHNANGRFVAVLGDGEYIIYTALAWRNKSFGSAADFAWSTEPNDYATRDAGSSTIKLHKNFKVRRPPLPACGLLSWVGGLLGLVVSCPLGAGGLDSASLYRHVCRVYRFLERAVERDT